MHTPFRLISVSAAVLLFTGCAAVNFDQTLNEARENSKGLVPGTLELRQTDAQRRASAKRSEQLLAQPLSMTDAVQLALANSPALQTLLAQSPLFFLSIEPTNPREPP